MRNRTGHIIGGLFISCNPQDKQNPISFQFEDENPCPDQPMDIEDAENLIKILRSMIRRVKRAS